MSMLARRVARRVARRIYRLCVRLTLDAKLGYMAICGWYNLPCRYGMPLLVVVSSIRGTKRKCANARTAPGTRYISAAAVYQYLVYISGAVVVLVLLVCGAGFFPAFYSHARTFCMWSFVGGPLPWYIPVLFVVGIILIYTYPMSTEIVPCTEQRPTRKEQRQ